MLDKQILNLIRVDRIVNIRTGDLLTIHLEGNDKELFLNISFDLADEIIKQYRLDLGEPTFEDQENLILKQEREIEDLKARLEQREEFINFLRDKNHGK